MFERLTQWVDDNIGIIALVVFVVSIGAMFGVFGVIESGVPSEPALVATGDTSSAISDTESAINYESLSETEQDNFREVQPQVYDGDSYTISPGVGTEYSAYSHIQLDGTYYEITVEQQPTTVGILLQSSLLIFGIFGAVSGAIVLISANLLLSYSFTAEQVRDIAKLVVLVSILVAALTPIGIAVTGDYIEATETSTATSEDITDFSELSSEQQSTAISLISGEHISVDQSSITAETYIRSDGEIYYINSTNGLTAETIGWSIVGALGSGFLSLTFVMNAVLEKERNTDSHGQPS